MSKKDFYIVKDGKLIRNSKLRIDVTNRAFKYGDGIFETMHYHAGQVLFLTDHLHRLQKGLNKLKINPIKPVTSKSVVNQIIKLLKHNKIRGDARIRLQVTRADGGNYEPISNTGSIIISAEPLLLNGFSLNKKGLKMVLCKNVALPLFAFSSIKSCNSLPYVMAALYAKEKKADNCILLNTKGKVAESVGSNLFIIKSGIVTTPPIKDGCLEGVMRNNVLKLLRKNEIPVKEKSITIKDIKNADEIFLTNVIKGIQWVRFYEKNKYNNKFTREIFGELTKSIALFV